MECLLFMLAASFAAGFFVWLLAAGGSKAKD